MTRAKQNKNPKTDHNRTGNQPAQRASRRRNRGNADPADWGSANPELIAAAIVALTRVKCAVQFGYTNDGGAFVIRIVGDGDEPYNEYVRPTEDIDLYLEGLRLDFEDAV